jgi:hypothetical protein
VNTQMLQLGNPLALQQEIEKLIHYHYRVYEITSFGEQYPEIYGIYVKISKQLKREGVKLPRT